MEYYWAIKNNDFMKLTGKWMELENTMLSEESNKKKKERKEKKRKEKKYMICTHWQVDINPKAQITQDTINRTHKIQKGWSKLRCFSPS